jgi:hypothetical protein
MNKPKRILNTIAVVALAGFLSVAYGTCYLPKAILAIIPGDDLGSMAVYSCSAACPSSQEEVYANDDAWKWDVYSVTSGGVGTGTSTIVPDDLMSNMFYKDVPPYQAGSCFQAEYYYPWGMYYTTASVTASLSGWVGAEQCPGYYLNMTYVNTSNCD